MIPDIKDKESVIFAMKLSLWIGLLMFVIKVGAYILTGSSAILSDASESVVHVAAVLFAAYSLRLSYKEPDEEHLYGHTKISFFSAGFEGAMIVIAAIYIIYEAVHKWLQGLHLENLGIGTTLTAFAAVLNGVLGLYLLKKGKKQKSLILEANGKHVLTDSWTSLGVLAGLGLTILTGWLPWDPIFAIFVALNILYSGFGLMRQSISGLMDTADPAVHKEIIEILKTETDKHNILFHHVLHRNLGNLLWIDLHLLFPEDMSIKEAHHIATQIENSVEKNLDQDAYVTTHLEAIEDHEEVHSEGSH